AVDGDRGGDAVQVAEVGRGVRRHVNGVGAGPHVEGHRGGGVLQVGRVIAGVGVELQRGAGVVDGEVFRKGGGVGTNDADEAEAAAGAVVGDGAGCQAGDLAAADDDVAVAGRGAEVADDELIAAGVGRDGQGAVDPREGAGVAGGIGGDVDDVIAGAALVGRVVVRRL